MLGSDAVYINRITAGTSHLTGYDLATGAVRWETLTDHTTGAVDLTEPAGRLLMGADRQSGGVDGVFVEYHRSTVAVDARTGREVWTVPGQVLTADGGTALMGDFSDRGDITRVRLIRLADGGVVWRRETSALHTFTPATDRIVTATTNGRVEVLRRSDGAVLRSGQVRWVTPKPGQNQFDDVTVAGDHLVVSRRWAERGATSVYRLDTLAEQWQIEYSGYTFACGTLLCVHDQSRMTAYDLTTGRLRWERPATGNIWPAAPDRLVLDADDGTGLIVLDVRTGAAIGGRVRGGTTVWTTDRTDDLYLLTPTTSPPDRTAVARLDLDTGRRHLLGTTDMLAGYRCWLTGHYLACNRDHHLEITAVGR
jgi:outer membrane protein assembly factor BamB